MQKPYFLGSNLILDLSFIGYVDLNQITKLSLPQSSHLWNGDNNTYIHNIVMRIKVVNICFIRFFFKKTLHLISAVQ